MTNHNLCVDFAVLHYNKGTKKLHDWWGINIALQSAVFRGGLCQNAEMAQFAFKITCKLLYFFTTQNRLLAICKTVCIVSN